MKKWSSFFERVAKQKWFGENWNQIFDGVFDVIVPDLEAAGFPPIRRGHVNPGSAKEGDLVNLDNANYFCR